MHGHAKRYNNNGIIISEGMYENGQKEGINIEYWDIEDSYQHKPKIRKTKGNYSKNKLNGSNIKMYDNKGMLRFVGNFVDDKKEGIGRQYHTNGGFEYEGMFKDGKLNDKFLRIYGEEGFPVFEGKYVAGRRTGWGKVWDLDGKLRVFGFFNGSHHVSKNKPYFSRDAQGKLVEHMSVKVF